MTDLLADAQHALNTFPTSETETTVILGAHTACAECGAAIDRHLSVNRVEHSLGRRMARHYPLCTPCATSHGHEDLALYCEAMHLLDRAMQAADGHAARQFLVEMAKGAAEHFAVWRNPDSAQGDDQR